MIFNMLFLGGDPGSINMHMPSRHLAVAYSRSPRMWSCQSGPSSQHEVLNCFCVSLTFRFVQIDIKHSTKKYSRYLDVPGAKESIIWRVISLFPPCFGGETKRVTLPSWGWKNHIVFKETEKWHSNQQTSSVIRSFPSFLYSAAQTNFDHWYETLWQSAGQWKIRSLNQSFCLYKAKQLVWPTFAHENAWLIDLIDWLAFDKH